MNAAQRFALIIGLLLLVEGIWGFYSPVVFGVLTTNRLHATIHVLLGGAGVFSVVRRRPRGFLIFLGVLLVAVGGLWFVPAIGDLLFQWLKVNRAVACVNLVVGLVSLVMAAQVPPVPASVRKRK
jgi:Domain of unknown function (DUF4383)